MYFGPSILEGEIKVATLNQILRAEEPQPSFITSLNASFQMHFHIFNVNSNSNGASPHKAEQKKK